MSKLLVQLVAEVASAFFRSVGELVTDWWRDYQLDQAQARATTLEAYLEGSDAAEQAEKRIAAAAQKARKVESWSEF
jgi:hypothetical protein